MSYGSNTVFAMDTLTDQLAYCIVERQTDKIVYANKEFFRIWGASHLEGQLQSDTLYTRDIFQQCQTLARDSAGFFDLFWVSEEYECSFIEGEMMLKNGQTILCTLVQTNEGEEYAGEKLYLFQDVTKEKAGTLAAAADRGTQIKL